MSVLLHHPVLGHVPGVGRGPEVAEWDRWHAYFTPTPVAQQGVQTVAPLLAGRPLRIADLGAGAGVLGLAAAQAFPGSLRLAVEPRGSELPHLRRHYQQVAIGTLREHRRQVEAFGPDWIIANPPFPRTLEFLAFAAALACTVLFFVRASFGDELETYDWLEEHPPAAELVIGGRPNLRRTGSLSRRGHPQRGDNTAHKWLLYTPGGSGVSWVPRVPLPRLPGPLLAWTERPGTEPEPPPPLPHYLVGELPALPWLQGRARRG
jgi:hypothetical protein